MIKPFYKVGFMRNPLVRLISGFRDKVLRWDVVPFFLFEVCKVRLSHRGALVPSLSESFKIYSQEWRKPWIVYLTTWNLQESGRWYKTRNADHKSESDCRVIGLRKICSFCWGRYDRKSKYFIFAKWCWLAITSKISKTKIHSNSLFHW